MQSSGLCSSGFLSIFLLTTRNRCIIWFAVFNFNSSKSVSIVSFFSSFFFCLFNFPSSDWTQKNKPNKFTCNNEKSNKLNFRVNSLFLPKWGYWQDEKKTKGMGGNLVIYNNWKWGKQWENSWESTLLELFGAAKRYTSKLLHTHTHTHGRARTRTHTHTRTGETTQRDKCVWPSHGDRTKESNNRVFFISVLIVGIVK